MKACSKCGVVKPLDAFHPRPDRPCGVVPACKVCSARRAAIYYVATREVQMRRARDWARAHPKIVASRVAAWRLAHPDRIKPRTPEQRAAYWQLWRAANPAAIRALKANRRAAQKQAVALWANRRAMLATYREAQRLTVETGALHVVDHIVPLQSPLVCGLHVEHNLQVLPFLDNCSKGNRWWPDGPEDAR